MAVKKEIRITDFEGVKVGHAERRELGSGCTAVIFEKGLLCGCEVRGGSPATRDTQTLRSEMTNQRIYGVMLTGGSAYGLDTCTGAMNYLTEQGIGTQVRDWRIPVVVGASIFDFPVSGGRFRPDAELGYEAAANASKGAVAEGSVGGGTGATVSKYLGLEQCIKGGIGTYGLQIGDLKVAAIVNVNAFGDIYDTETGTQITGPLTEDRKRILNAVELMYEKLEHDAERKAGKNESKSESKSESNGESKYESENEAENSGCVSEQNVLECNTTVGLIITNACLNKGQMNKVAAMTHNGYARAIRPVHSSVDGDTVFAATTNEVQASVDVVGILASEVMEKAIVRAVQAADSLAGIPALRDL